MIKRTQEKIYQISKKWGNKIGLDLPYFVKNGFWVVFRQGIGTVGGLALSVSFARLATQEVFGQYQFILSILSIVSILSIPGLNTSIIQSAAKGYDGDYKKVVRASFLWSLLGVPILLIVGMYYYAFQNHSLGIAFMLSSIFFPFFYAPNTWDSFLQGKSRFDISAKYSSIQSLINTIATIGVIFFYRDNLVAIVAIYLISFSFFNGYYYYKSLQYVENEKSDKDTIKYGWFLTKLSVLGFISGNIDKILIGILLSPTSLAIYSIGILMTKQLQDNTKSILSIFAPKQVKYNSLPLKHYLYLFLLGATIAIIGLVAIKFILPLLFSEKYISAIYISQISIAFYPFFILALIFKNQILFSNKKDILFRESIISPIVKIILTIILLPLFGINGLAFLFGFQYFIIFVVLYSLDRGSFCYPSNKDLKAIH